MCAQFYWSRVVWHNGYAYRLIPFRNLLVDRLHDARIEVAYGLQLQLKVAIMTCLVACFDMQKHEVVGF